MSLPAGWPPRKPSGRASIRVFLTGTATALYSDNAYIFSQVAGANPYTPTPVVRAGGERVNANIGTTAGGSPPMGTGTTDASTAPGSGDSQTTVPMIWASTIRIINDGGGDLTFSFDGTNTHGIVKANQTLEYRNRMEAGIAVKGVGATFRIEAW